MEYQHQQISNAHISQSSDVPRKQPFPPSSPHPQTIGAESSSSSILMRRRYSISTSHALTSTEVSTTEFSKWVQSNEFKNHLQLICKNDTFISTSSQDQRDFMFHWLLETTMIINNHLHVTYDTKESQIWISRVFFFPIYDLIRSAFRLLGDSDEKKQHEFIDPNANRLENVHQAWSEFDLSSYPECVGRSLAFCADASELMAIKRNNRGNTTLPWDVYTNIRFPGWRESELTQAAQLMAPCFAFYLLLMTEQNNKIDSPKSPVINNFSKMKSSGNVYSTTATNTTNQASDIIHSSENGISNSNLLQRRLSQRNNSIKPPTPQSPLEKDSMYAGKNSSNYAYDPDFKLDSVAEGITVIQTIDHGDTNDNGSSPSNKIPLDTQSPRSPPKSTRSIQSNSMAGQDRASVTPRNPSITSIESLKQQRDSTISPLMMRRLSEVSFNSDRHTTGSDISMADRMRGRTESSIAAFGTAFQTNHQYSTFNGRRHSGLGSSASVMSRESVSEAHDNFSFTSYAAMSGPLTPRPPGYAQSLSVDSLFLRKESSSEPQPPQPQQNQSAGNNSPSTTIIRGDASESEAPKDDLRFLTTKRQLSATSMKLISSSSGSPVIQNESGTHEKTLNVAIKSDANSSNGKASAKATSEREQSNNDKNDNARASYLVAYKSNNQLIDLSSVKSSRADALLKEAQDIEFGAGLSSQRVDELLMQIETNSLVRKKSQMKALANRRRELEIQYNINGSGETSTTADEGEENEEHQTEEVIKEDEVSPISLNASTNGKNENITDVGIENEMKESHEKGPKPLFQSCIDIAIMLNSDWADLSEELVSILLEAFMERNSDFKKVNLGDIPVANAYAIIQAAEPQQLLQIPRQSRGSNTLPWSDFIEARFGDDAINDFSHLKGIMSDSDIFMMILMRKVTETDVN